MTEHRLRITPTESGFWLVSNGRTWFLDRQMLNDLTDATSTVLRYPEKEWRNYEEPKREAVVVTRAAKPTLNDVLDML